MRVMPTSFKPAVAQVLGAAVLFGTTGTAQALGPAGTTPLGVGAVRLALGGAVLLGVLPLLGGRSGRAVALWRSPLGLAAGVCTALYQLCFFAAVKTTGVALGTLLTIGSGPVFAGLLALFLLGENARSFLDHRDRPVRRGAGVAVRGRRRASGRAGRRSGPGAWRGKIRLC